VSSTIWDKLGNIDYRILYALSLILMLIPIIRPIGLPTPVSETVRGFYETIDNLPPGSVVFVSLEGSLSLLDEQEAQYIATLKILFQRDLKVVFYSVTEDGELIYNYLFSVVNPEKYGKKYGIDYVRLGYAPLEERGQAAVALDVRSVYPRDFYGTPLDEIPMMKDIHNWKDVDLLIYYYTSCTNVEFAIRQWVIPYHTKCIVGTLGCCGPMAVPYFPDYIQGILSGSGAGAELEVISGNPGPGAMMNDAKNFGILGLLLFLILGNVSYLGKRFGGESE